MPRFKTRRRNRFIALVNRFHFHPVEAREFSKLNNNYPALKALKRSKLAAWANYQQWVGKQAWLELTDKELWAGWDRRIYRFYARLRIKRRKDKDTGLSVETLTNWLVKRDVHGRRFRTPQISPWDWYDAIFARLPEELKWDTPRSGRRAKQPDVDINKVQVQRQRRQWIADLRRTIEREPRRKVELEKQIRRLGGRP